MDKSEVIKKLKKYKELISNQIAVEELILFGSYANGTNREDSMTRAASCRRSLPGVRTVK